MALLLLPLGDPAGRVVVAEVNRRRVDAEHALDAPLGVDGLEGHAERAQVATLHADRALSFQQACARWEV